MDRIDQMQNDISEIKTFLIGGDFNDKGVAARLNTLEKQQDSDKKLRWMGAGAAVVISFLLKFVQ